MRGAVLGAMMMMGCAVEPDEQDPPDWIFEADTHLRSTDDVDANAIVPAGDDEASRTWSYRFVYFNVQCGSVLERARLQFYNPTASNITVTRTWFHADGTVLSFVDYIPPGTLLAGRSALGILKVRVSGYDIGPLQLLPYENYCL